MTTATSRVAPERETTAGVNTSANLPAGAGGWLPLSVSHDGRPAAVISTDTALTNMNGFATPDVAHDELFRSSMEAQAHISGPNPRDHESGRPKGRSGMGLANTARNLPEDSDEFPQL